MMIRMEKSKSSSFAFDVNNVNVVPMRKKKKKTMLSESEMEAARQLIELSNGDSSSGHRSVMGGDAVEDNNSSSNSFSVQGRPQEEEEQKSKLDDVNVSSNVETIMDEGESLGEIRRRRRRKNKRYRFVLDLYRVTEPVISCY